MRNGCEVERASSEGGLGGLFLKDEHGAFAVGVSLFSVLRDVQATRFPTAGELDAVANELQ